MKPSTELAGKRVLVVGLARTGLATAQFCAARGAQVSVVEQRPEGVVADATRELRALGVHVECGGNHPDLFAGADLIVPSPGVPANIPELVRARETGVTVWSEIELAWRFLRGRLIAVTGSNGKTTTVSLLGHILNGANLPTLVGGNIGTPLISLVDQSSESTITIAEVSTFQLELAEAFRPDIAILLNITPDHLDRHASFQDYANLKRRIFVNQGKGDAAVLNADAPEVSGYLPDGPRIFWFSRQRCVDLGACICDGQLVLCLGGTDIPLLPRAEVPLPGEHNLENALAASLAAHLAGVPAEAIAAGVRSFKAVEHRLEFVAEIGGVRFYNDSKATNVDAALRALQSFTEPVHIILGGKDKGGDFTALREPLRLRARQALLMGDAAEKIASQLGGVVPVEFCGTLSGAVGCAFAAAQSGEIILLAPACASFDQFQNFEHRGRVFKQLVTEVQQNLMAEELTRKG